MLMQIIQNPYHIRNLLLNVNCHTVEINLLILGITIKTNLYTTHSVLCTTLTDFREFCGVQFRGCEQLSM